MHPEFHCSLASTCNIVNREEGGPKLVSTLVWTKTMVQLIRRDLILGTSKSQFALKDSAAGGNVGLGPEGLGLNTLCSYEGALPVTLRRLFEAVT